MRTPTLTALAALALAALLPPTATAQSEDLPDPPVLTPPRPAPASPATLATPDVYLQLAALTDGEDEAPRFIRQVIERLSRQLVNVDAATWEEIAASLDPVPTSQVVADIYAKHLSEEEASELVAFYLSPLGTRLREVQPTLIRESVAAKQLWGREVMAQILLLVEEKTGLKLEEAPPASTPAPEAAE